MSQPSNTITSQVHAMLSLQDSMNKKVHAHWVAQKFDWYRAAWIECGELMDHLGYKWWKQQICDEEQVRLEVVDIWHFALSSYFTQTSELDDLAQQIAAEITTITDLEQLNFTPSNWGDAQRQAVKEATETLAQACLSDRIVPVKPFWALLKAVGFDLQSLYVAYVGKNVLNFFRQDNGYKTGEYKKLWRGREDNEHLSELVHELDSHSDSFRDDLYSALEQRYATA